MPDRPEDPSPNMAPRDPEEFAESAFSDGADAIKDVLLWMEREGRKKARLRFPEWHWLIEELARVVGDVQTQLDQTPVEDWPK